MQGGVIAALADEAVAYALYSLVADGETFNTVEMKINFLGAVKEGNVTAEAHIAKRGRTICPGRIRGAPGRPSGGQGAVYLYSSDGEEVSPIIGPRDRGRQEEKYLGGRGSP